MPLDESEIITIFSKDKPQAEEDANAAKQKALDDVEKLTKGKTKAQSLLDPKVLLIPSLDTTFKSSTQ